MKIKINSKKLYNIALRVLVGILVIVSVMLVPTIIVSVKSPINKNFTQNRSDYQGVLEIWNIDSFEGGTAGKTLFLQNRAIDYEKQNKGLYFMIKNMTETECILALENNQLPAMFSFGVGIGEKLLPYLTKIAENQNLRADFAEAGSSGGDSYATAWCRGVYCLISTASKIEKSKQDATKTLSSLAIDCGFTQTLKNNKVKTTYSLAFGSAGYVCPQLAYASSFKNLVQNQTSISPENLTKTPYKAYCDFIEDKATILLGTQRDIARIENRVKLGKIDSVIYEALGGYTDLVQYMSIVKSDNNKAQEACQGFINYLTSPYCQQKLANMGMFSVCNNTSIYSEGIYATLEQQILQNCSVPNAFLPSSEISVSKQSCIDAEQV